MNEREIVAWVDDAIERHNRESERFGDDGPWTDEELYDGIWGRLPVRVRRACPRSSFETPGGARGEMGDWMNFHLFGTSDDDAQR